MNTTQPFNKGSLVVMDALHLPYGVSRLFCKNASSLRTSSALFGRRTGAKVARRTLGPHTVRVLTILPRANLNLYLGEIDIVENVNLAPVNQMALHTSQGCTLAPETQVTGKIVSNDCYNNTNGNQGCIVQMPDNSYGQSFAA